MAEKLGEGTENNCVRSESGLSVGDTRDVRKKWLDLLHLIISSTSTLTAIGSGIGAIFDRFFWNLWTFHVSPLSLKWTLMPDEWATRKNIFIFPLSLAVSVVNWNKLDKRVFHFDPQVSPKFLRSVPVMHVSVSPGVAIYLQESLRARIATLKFFVVRQKAWLTSSEIFMPATPSQRDNERVQLLLLLHARFLRPPLKD